MTFNLKNITFFLFCIILLKTEATAQIGRLHLSPRQTINQNIGLTDVTIDYSRPAKRGRHIFGELVPYGKYWRTGANQNTTIKFNQDFFIDNKRIKKGKYSMITKPDLRIWEFILYDEIENWDVPEEIDSAKIVAKITVQPQLLNKPREVLAIEIGDFNNYQFDLNIYWDNIKVAVPIGLNTKELMDKKIKDHLEGPSYGDYYLAAVYQMESGKEYDKGLEWINKAIEISDEAGWWDYRVKAILLMKLNQFREAKLIAEKGLKLAETDNREYPIGELRRILNELK